MIPSGSPVRTSAFVCTRCHSGKGSYTCTEPLPDSNPKKSRNQMPFLPSSHSWLGFFQRGSVERLALVFHKITRRFPEDFWKKFQSCSRVRHPSPASGNLQLNSLLSPAAPEQQSTNASSAVLNGDYSWSSNQQITGLLTSTLPYREA